MAVQIQGQELEYKPWGGLAGIRSGERAANTDAANMLALQESQLGNVIKGVEAGRASSDFANPEMEQLRQAGIMGKDKTASATGEYDQGMLKSKLEKGIAENISGKSAAQIEQGLNQDYQTLQGLRKASSFLESSAAQNPAYVAEAFQRFGQELGIDPKMQQQLMQQEQQKPGTLKEIIKTLIPQLEYGITHTRASMVKMAEQAQKGTIDEGIHAGDRRSREKVSAADNTARTSIEEMGIEAGKYKRGGAGVSITTVFAKMTPTARLGAVQKVLTTGVDPETNEPLTEMAKAGYEAMYNQDKRTVDAGNAARSTGKIDTPAVAGLPNAAPPSVGGSGGAKPVSGGHWEVQGGKKVWIKG